MTQGLWGRENDGGTVLDAARRRVAQMFDEYDYVVVSFSGGKDSTVVLNLCLEEARRRNATPLRVVFFDEEAIHPETEAYARRVADLPDVDLRWYCVPLRHRNGAGTDDGYWFPWALEDREKWVRDLPPEAITTIPGVDLNSPEGRTNIADLMPHLLDAREGRAAVALGIRASESITRLKMVTMRGRADNWIVPPDRRTPFFTKAYPIYDWQTSDVWTAPATLGWDYNRFYDYLEMAGVSHSQQRCAPPFGDEPLRGLHLWQETAPELWDRMCERVPGAATAARYANTELYGAYEALHIGASQTPQDYIKQLIDTHATNEMRNSAALAVRAMIRRHYKKTSEPIALNAQHPDTGTSWRIIAKAARTGDLKQRVQSGLTVPTSKNARHHYLTELYHLRENGATWLPAQLPPLEDQDGND